MHQFSVWAPDAGTVDLQLRDRTIAMTQAGPAGWWSVDVDCESHGVDYAFRLDRGEPMPDPRSPWQPSGVHGFSRTVDHSRFAWHDAGWQPPPLDVAIIYELHIGTFTPAGTFDAAIDRLAYLRDLGVTHVELMPVVEFAGDRNWGYDGVDLFAPHHDYGGPDGLKRLIDACHATGLAVLIDVVYNHFGPEGGYAPKFGPYLTSEHRSPWGDAINLDGPGSDEVRQFFLDNATMWLRDYHADGLRLDAVHAFIDNSAITFLEQLADHVGRLRGCVGRRLVLIAESDLNNPRLIEPPAAGGYGLDAQWSDDFHHSVHALLTGDRYGYHGDFGRLADLADALTRVFVYSGRFSEFRGRRHGRPIRSADGSNFVVCIQNHDQTGNRAVGERFGHLVDERRNRVAVGLLLASPCVPLLFMGEEWNASSPFQYFTSFLDPQLAQMVREGRARDFERFGWDHNAVPDPQAEDTFKRSKLNWQEVTRARHASTLQWYRELLDLRRRTPDLREPRLSAVSVNFDEQARWLVFTRSKVIVACNLASESQSVPLPGGGAREVLLASDRVKLYARRICMPGMSIAIIG